MSNILLNKKFKPSFSTIVFLIFIIMSFISDAFGVTKKGFGKTHIFFVFICLAFAIVSGYIRFKTTVFIRKLDSVKKELLLALISSLISLFVFDLILKLAIPPAYKATKYGWVCPANSEEHRIVQDSPGKLEEITVKYFDYGFKRWGDVNTKKIKMFIIGDSYAQMRVVSNGEEWYSYLEKKIDNLELFVYGGGGYGSLQEFMVLDDFIDKIKPDLILLQFCYNDFNDNSFISGLKCYPFNSGAFSFRPYLQNDKIVYKLPLPLSELRENSFLASRILGIYDRIALKIAKKDLRANNKKRIENSTKKKKEAGEQIENDSFIVTNQIMAMLSKRAGNVPIYFLNVSDPTDPRGKELCRRNNFTYIPRINEYIVLNKKKYCLRVVGDGHWNKSGNKLVGEKLIEYFEKEGILRNSNPAIGVN